MIRSVWQKWLKQITGRSHRPPGRGADRRPQFELLEDRVVPAATITVKVGVIGDGSLDGELSPTDGTIEATVDPGDTAATVSTGALAQVLPNVDISITAEGGIVFNDLGGKFTLQTAAGHTAAFIAQGTSPGSTIQFSNTANTLATSGGGLSLLAQGVPPGNLTPAGLSSGGGTIELDGNNISLQQPVNAGTGLVKVLALGNVGGSGAITGSGLAVQAGTGITLPGVNVSALDFQNSTSGAVAITNVGPLLVTNLAGFGPASNAAPGPAGTTTLITGGGSITFGVNTSSVGDLSATAGDTAGATDFLTIASGVTVSGSGNVSLTAGDDLSVPAGATLSAAGNLTLVAGINADNVGAMDLEGTITGGGLTHVHSFTAQKDVTLGTLLNLPSSTVTITSSQGAIVDANDTSGTANNVVATTLNLFAARGIGSSIVPANPIEVTVANLRAENTVSGDVLVTNLTGDLAVRGVNAGAGPFQITLGQPGATLTVTGNNIVTNTANAPVILIADNMTIAGAINAGTGTVTLQPLTGSRAIELGTDGTGTTLGLTDAELDLVTAGFLLIGGPNQTGNVTFTAPVSAPLGRNTNLGLVTAGTITQNAAATVTGPGGAFTLGLALVGGNGVNLPLTGNNANTIAGQVTALGAGFTFINANALTIGTVDGFNGIQTNAAPIDVETFVGGSLTVADTAVTNDVNSTGGAITLIARGGGQAFNLGVGAGSAAVVRSGGAQILIQADNMTLNGPAGGINAGIGRVTLLPTTVGTLINLGGADSAVVPITLGLTNTELGTVVAGTLQVGDSASSGAVTVSAAVGPLTGIQTLDLETSGGVTAAGANGIKVTNLAIRAGNAVVMTGTGNDVTGSLAAQVTTGLQGFSFSDANDLTIGTVDGLAGVTTSNGAINVASGVAAGPGNLIVNKDVNAHAAPINLTVSQANATLTNNANITNSGAVNAINLTADRMVIGVGTVTSGGRVTLAPFTAGRAVDLGSTTDAAAALELSSAELFSVSTPGVFQVGNGANTGAVSVTAPNSIGAAVFTIFNGGGVTETAAGTISAASLRISSVGPVTLTGNNVVGTIAGALTGATQPFSFNNVGNLQVGNVDGVSGITTLNGSITVTTVNSDLTLNNNVIAQTPTLPNGQITLTAGGSEHLLTINPLQVSGTTATLTADRIAIVAPAAINVGTGAGDFVILKPVTANRPINLGAAGDPTGSLNLTDAELDTITAGLIRIGTATSGAITVSNPFTEGNSATTLSLVSGGAVNSTGAGMVGAANLAVQGAGGVNLTANPNTVTTSLAGTAGAAGFKFANSGSLFVNTADGINGITTTGGPVDLRVTTAGGVIGVQKAIATSNGNVTLTADDLDVQAAVNAGTGTVVFRPTTPAQVITLGTNQVGTMSLVDAELDRVTARVLRIGDPADTGNVNLGGLITQTGSGYAALSLVTGGAITDSTPLEQTDLDVSDLALSAHTGVGNLDDLNVAVTNLAVSNTVSGDVQITSTRSFTVAPAPGIDGVSGVTNGGPGNILLRSNAGVALGAAAVVQAGTPAAGGNITLIANYQTPAGTANVALGAGSQILTRGNIVINADPDGDGVGGTITSGAGVTLGAPGAGNLPNSISLTAAPDLALPGLVAATSVSATSTGGSLRDDGVDTTVLDAPTISLTAKGDIGGATALKADDVVNTTTAFLGAIDVDLAGLTTLNVTQNAAGNVQLRGVGGLFQTSTIQAGTVSLKVTGKQLALIGASGLVVDAALNPATLTPPSAGVVDLLLAATGAANPVNVNFAVTNAGGGPTTLVSTGGNVNLNAGVTGGTAATVTVRAAGGSITDGNGAGVTNVTGGPVNLRADAGTIDTDVKTTDLTAATTNAAINIRAEANSNLPVRSVTAGTGTVSLSTSNGSITDLSPNDMNPEVVAATINLTATGSGTIGTATGALEVDAGATTLNASTVNQNIWITDTAGGVAIGTVNAGTATATLGANGGAMISAVVNGVPDVIANTVVLTGTNSGSFGSAGSGPLEIAATTLSATTDGTGSIQVRDTGGGLTVTKAQTAGGLVSLQALGAAADLTVSQVVAGGGNIVNLSATGAVLGSGTAPQVTGGSLNATAGNGVGTAGSPLATAIGTLTANGGSGGVTLSNQGALTIGAGGVTGVGDVTLTVPESAPPAGGDDLTVPTGASVSSTGGAVTLQAGDTLTLAAGGTVTAAGALTLNGGFNDDGNGGAVAFLGSASGSTVSINGGSGPDTFTINPTSTNPSVAINGQAGADTFAVTPSATSTYNVTGGPPATIPGDTLAIALGGVTNPHLSAAPDPNGGLIGSWTFGNAQPITFNTIELITPTSTLTLSLTDNQTSAVPGTNVTYTLVVGNTGPTAANGATLTLPISGQLLNPTFTSTASGGATGNTASGSGSLNEVLNLPVGSSVTYTITGRIDPAATGQLTNTATLTAPQAAPDLTGASHTVSDTDTLTPSADVGVATALVGKPPVPGGRLTYSVIVTNTGPSDAQSVSFTDTLAAATVFSSVTQTAGPTFTLTPPAVGTNGVLTGSIATLPAGATATFQIVLKAFGQPGTQVGNKVTVATTTTDPNAANGSASTSTLIVATNLQRQIVVGTGNGGAPEVKVFDAGTGDLILDFFAYEDSFRGGVNVAQGDFNGDGIPDIVAGSGVGGGPVVKVFDGATGDLIRSFLAYEPTFRGGVNVSTGDINGDGVPDIFAGSGNGGGPAVKVFDGKTGNLIRSFFAYENSFRGGVIVNAGDVNGDGIADIIAGTGVGGGPVVKVFDGVTGTLIQSFFAYDPSVRGGVNVAAGDVNGDGFADIITGTGVGGAPNIRVFDGRTDAMINSFFAFNQAIPSGVNVAAIDTDGDGLADVVAGAGVGQQPQISVFTAPDLSNTNTFLAFDPSFTGGVFVG
jgi:uncharacterized repeat protein (TIGR01451 family)